MAENQLILVKIRINQKSYCWLEFLAVIAIEIKKSDCLYFLALKLLFQSGVTVCMSPPFCPFFVLLKGLNCKIRRKRKLYQMSGREGTLDCKSYG